MAGPFLLLLPLPSQRCRLLPAALPTLNPTHLMSEGTYLLLSPQLGACQFGDTEVKQAGHSKQQFIGEKKNGISQIGHLGWDLAQESLSACTRNA